MKLLHEKFGVDPYLAPFRGAIERRIAARAAKRAELCKGTGALGAFASGHEYYGLRREGESWIFREWAPNAEGIYLIGDFSQWRKLPQYALTRLNAHGDWEIRLPGSTLRHRMRYKLIVMFPGGEAERIPAYARYVEQDAQTGIFSASVWASETAYRFLYSTPVEPDFPLIYEAHAGMAQEEAKIGSFAEFRTRILPRIAAGGYNTLELMAVMSHPYYGSFGYHVANYFSISSRFGTPDEFKELVDEAHKLGLRVIIDLVHSHSVRNEAEGLARFDGTRTQYFHAGERGFHRLWDSFCFDYGKNEVLHFLLSNCRFWIDEYHIDGFRFDGVTSMIYFDHGLNRAFVSYDDYFNAGVDEEALVYLALANELVHEIRPDALTIAEDVSGMPGLAAPQHEGGCGFDYRMAMGVSDMWFKLFDIPDEKWSMHYLYHELTNRRRDERVISYVECHDQAIVGGQSAIFRLIGGEMYHAMRVDSHSERVGRGVALHKMCRLATAAAAGGGYLNFMGNEFGHPEWIDFPREGNHWSCHYARRQWSLADDESLYYSRLLAFDREMIALIRRFSLDAEQIQQLRIDEAKKIVAFVRGPVWFFFNFHPSDSFDAEPFEVLNGVYRILLDSEELRFGGSGCGGRICSQCEVVREGNAIRHRLTLALPRRSVVALLRG